MGSKDVYTSLIVTCGYLLVFELLLNKNSSINVLPDHLKRLEAEIDTNNNGVIEEKELEKAIDIIKKYKSVIKK